MNDNHSQSLVRLLTQHHDSLFRYAFSLLGNAEDARDVLQETSVALFQKQDQFDPSRPFLPWAYRFAYLEVLKWREKNVRKPLALQDDVIELLAADRKSSDDVLQRRMSLLPECFAALPKPDLALVRGRYFDGASIDSMVEKLGMSRRTLFRELERVRRALMNCIDTKLTAEET